MKATKKRINLGGWEKFALGACALVGFVGDASSIQAADSLPASATHFTQGSFRIPFQVQPGGRCPAQLDLLVSRDSGRTWHVHQSATPAEKAFEVTDADEGEFLIKVQARDGRAAVVSRSIMKLVVDRTPPQIDLTCDWQAESGLLIQCRVMDRSVDPQLVTLQLRTSNETEFVPVPTVVVLQQTDLLQLSSNVQLPACDSFELRVVANDKAENTATVSERFRHPEASSGLELTSSAEPQVAQQSGAKQLPGSATASLRIESSDWSAVTLAAPQIRPSMQLTGYVLPTRSDSSTSAKPVELTPPLDPPALQVNKPVASDTLELNAPAAPQSPPAVTASTSSSPGVANLPAANLPVTNIPRVETESRKLTLQYQFDQRQSGAAVAV